MRLNPAAKALAALSNESRHTTAVIASPALNSYNNTIWTKSKSVDMIDVLWIFFKTMIGETRKFFNNFLDSESKSAKAGKFILVLVLLSGIGILALGAPGIFSLAARYKYSKKFSKRQIENSLFNLKKNKYIEILREKGGKSVIRLTNKGQNRVKEYSLDEIRIKRPKKWDKKWRVLMFDIPVHPKSNNVARHALREKIRELGFVQLQKSVWAHPYECEDEILFIAKMYDVERYVDVLTVESSLHESLLYKKFKLKP